ncbi:MAG TPA: TatD family hydrolase [Nitrososphaerales archaeon]|nr:TatD family hydrolase [Nitrososphaerales archaeon]
MHAKLLDAHVHLTDDEFSPMLEDIMNMLRSLSMKAVSVSMDLTTARKNLELVSSYGDVVIPFLGIHPWSAAESLDQFGDFVAKNSSKIAGIGEIGLDRKYVADNEDGYKIQKQVFESMLSFAEKLAKPTSIHSRGSLDDVLSTLKSFSLKGVLLHWFAGSKKQLKQATDAGYYVSYGPVLVSSEDKRSLLRDTTKEFVLVETDGPVRYAGCFENKVALPSFLPSVVFAVARTLRLSYDDACNMLIQNSAKYLGFML